MKKTLLVLSLIFSLYLFINITIFPDINYSIIEYVQYSNEELQTMSIQSSEMSEQSYNVIIQIQLKYDAFSKQMSPHLKSLEDERDYTDEQLDNYKKEHRKEAKNYHKENNNRILNSLMFGNYQDIYISKYAPFIDVTYNFDYYIKHQTNILESLTKHKLVAGVSVRLVENVYKSEMADISNIIGGGDVYTNRTRTGSGVVVGILENGIIDTDHPDLINTIIDIKPNALNLVGVDEHTTNVALIIAGQKGIAYNAHILNAYLFGTLSDEVEWMLDNDVDIINMSFGEDGNYGIYSSVSAYVDYIMAEEFVIIVKSAGNRGGNGDYYITNPGLAYNVLTVGSVGYDCEVCDFSSYESIDGPQKPTISIYGMDIDVSDEAAMGLSGTSFSTALITGYLAWIIQSHSSLVVNREKLYALLVANAYNSSYQDFDTACGFDCLVGAGVFNYANFEENYANAGVKANSSGNGGDVIYTKQVHLNYGDTLRASIASIASSNGTVMGITFTDYDVVIKDYNGNIVASGHSDNSIIEVATYTARAGGNYTFEIVQISNRVKNKDYIGYAYRIY